MLFDNSTQRKRQLRKQDFIKRTMPEKPFQYKVRLKHDILLRAAHIANDSEEAQQDQLQKICCGKNKCSTESEAQRQDRLEKKRSREKKRRVTESEAQRQDRLQKMRSWEKKRRVTESEAQRQDRLQKMRSWENKRRFTESEAQRQDRLKELRCRRTKRLATESIEAQEHRVRRSRIRRVQLRKKVNLDVQQFERCINVFADKHCEVCLKRSYPNQLSTFLLPEKIPSYLPPELAAKEFLTLCHRCRSHLSSSKKICPSKSYWNNLDPGQIPNEIRCLTQVEQRLLSRIIPFIKVIKFKGLYGQYGFKGQAILFAQDIFEVTERLPNMLPRSLESTGIVVIVEELENLDVRRQFQLSRDRTNSALNWLICNNPLYSDVTNVSAANPVVEMTSVVRVQQVHQNPNFGRQDSIGAVSEFVSVNNLHRSRLVRATWNQSSLPGANSIYAGRQCAVMALSMLVKKDLLPPTQWNTLVCNEILLEGDALYGRVRVLMSHTGVAVPASGYLWVNNFQVIRTGFLLFGTSVHINFDGDSALYGSMQDNKNEEGFGKTLLQALSLLFEHHSGGILIASSKAYAVARCSGKFYFFDSHSCGPKGAPSRNKEGRSCLIECDTLDELNRICKRSTSSRNVEYTLDYIDVVLQPSVTLQPPPHATGSTDQVSQDLPVEIVLPLAPTFPIPVVTSVMRPIDYQQPREDEVLSEVTNTDLNKIRRKTTDNIVNVAHELKAEEFAWYYLFPYGKNGFKGDRPVSITPLDYYQYRILGTDLRFQRNDYLFYALSMYELYRIKATISVCGKKIRNNNSMVDDLHLYVKNLRGSAAYWRTALTELVAQIRCLGPPHFFVTLSCNDLHWNDMIRALLKANGDDADPDGVTSSQVQSLIEMYPTVVSRHFMIRLNALMTHIRANPEYFGGNIVDFWWRVEFQNRGSPHLHMVIWVEGTPDFGTEAGINRINEVISCRLPRESDLKKLVEALQIHRHTQTCYKHSSSLCRFGFPRASSDQTRIIHHTSNDFVSNGGRICILQRNSGEEYINNYNPGLLKLWKANMDIQPCGSNEAIAFYIAKYISKNEPTEFDSGLREAINKIRKEEGDVPRKMFKICMSLLNERQVSACECVFRLCHLRMRESSRKCVFLNTRKPEQRYRVLTFGNDDAATGFACNIFDRYEKRPLQHPNYNFAAMSLMEFAMLFEPYYSKKLDVINEDIDADVHEEQAAKHTRLLSLLDNTKMRIRNVPAVVRVPFLQQANDPENFYYSLLVQYAPYRREYELLEGYDTAKSAFIAREHELKASSAHMELHRKRDRQLENAFLQAHTFEELVNYDPPADEDAEDVPDFEMPDNDFQYAKRAMNVEQVDLFNFITSKIRTQIDGSSDRIRLFVTGGAGTGKTFTLNILKEQIRRCYGCDKVSFRVCALTGVAARLVGGSTLHSALKLPVQKDGKLVNMSHLTGKYLKVMRNLWRDIEFLIIDEISMVPYEMLCMVDQRLKQIKDKCDDMFGGVNVLLFGDLMQLPPVRGNLVFEQPNRMQPATNLWREFSFCELTRNMRQQGDSTFVDLLNNLRMGALNAEQIQLLMGKIEGNNQGEFAVGKALRIHPTIKQVDEHNAAVLVHFQSANVVMSTIIAQDRIVDATRNMVMVDIDTLIPSDVNKTGGLPKQLTLFQGAKVMLRYNVDTGKGLVNGAIGSVTEIKWPLFRRAQVYDQDIPSVLVDFGDVGVHLIEPRSVQFSAKYSAGTAERRMLPLILCWSSTVHKLQGCTIDHAVINLGPKVFAPGQAYVALSRVRCLDGVRLEDLDCIKITGPNVCNAKALAEMQRLRSLPHYSDQ